MLYIQKIPSFLILIAIFSYIYYTYEKTKYYEKYKNIVIDMLRYNFPLLTETELAAAVDYSISKHFSDTNVKIDNNAIDTIEMFTALDELEKENGINKDELIAHSAFYFKKKLNICMLF